MVLPVLLDTALVASLSIAFSGFGTAEARRGPTFIKEPPERHIFLNSTGTIVPCLATGNPIPVISWTKKDGSPIPDVPGLRPVRADGSLVFQPFRAEEYRQDVHDAVYRCTASNAVGIIGSRLVHVRGVVLQDFQAHVYDEYVIRGNTAVLRCHVPTFVKEFLVVTSWIRDDGIVIVPHKNAAKYLVLKEGELHIRNAQREDSFKRFRCRVKNLLSGDMKSSSSAGQLIVTDPTGSIPPRITSGRSAIEATEYSSIELPCAAQGYPIPTYRWFKEEGSQLLPVHLGDRRVQVDGTLILERALAQDAGKYVCIVNNSVGEERVETELVVRGNLSVRLHPEELTVESGRSATFNCTISGYPINSVVWTRNLRRLVSNSRIRIIANQVLHITSVEREDQGMYQCFLFGDSHSAQGTAQLTLSEDAPDFKYVFSRHLIQPGERFSLRCVAIGNPLPRVTWTLDNRPILENHRVQYGDFVSVLSEVVSFVNVTMARPEDGGVYTCTAQNDAGHVSHTDKVDIQGPPFIRSMDNVTVVAGEKLMFRCPVSGYPVAAISWTKDGRELPFNERQQVFANGTVVVNDVAREPDEGNYVCTATNKHRETARKELNIRVIKKPIINPFSFPTTLAEGMRVIVTCSVLTGDPPIAIRWIKDGLPLASDTLNVEESSLGDLGSSLVFNSLDRKHNGNYTCVAENTAGITKFTATMLVNVPPRWRIEPTDISSIVGVSVIFDCQAEGYPQPLIRWKKATGEASARNFRSIISNYHIQMLENGSLSIKDVQKGDEGHYLCEVANGIGADLSTVVKLSVHVAAHFKTNFRVQRVKKSSSVSLQCEAFGERPIAIQWSKDKLFLQPSSDPRYTSTEHVTPEGKQSILTVASADRKDSALFSCVATNAYGKDETNIQVLVEEVPDPPSDFKSIEITSRSVSVSWAVPYTGNSPITKYILQWKLIEQSWLGDVQQLEISGANSTILVKNLNPVTTYHFRVIAENSLGRSAPTLPLTITTDEEVPGIPPEDVMVIPTSSQSIRVSWKVPDQLNRYGKIRGFYVGYKVSGSSEAFVYKILDITHEFSPECIVTNLRRDTKYTIIVQAFNSKGAGPPSKEVEVKTYETDPPLPPVHRIVSSTSSSVVLAWERPETNPVKGYTIFYKQDNGEWEETEVSGDKNTHSFQALNCGTRYQFYMVAHNNVGKSDPSDIISVTTHGGAPVSPEKNALLLVNSTFVVLNLNGWHDGGCSISFFVVQYKQRGQREWTLVSNNIIPSQETVLLSSLKPATRYNLLMSAHNEAGITEAEYLFATLTPSGATITPIVADREEGTSFYRNLSVIVPIVCAVVVLLVITLVILIVCVKKSRSSDYAATSQGPERHGDPKGDNISMASVGKKLYETPREPLYYPSPYATTRISMYSGDSESSSGQTSSLQRPGATRPDHTYDVPFPPKQYCGKNTRCSSVSHDYQTLFTDPLHPEADAEERQYQCAMQRAYHQQQQHHHQHSQQQQHLQDQQQPHDVKHDPFTPSYRLYGVNRKLSSTRISQVPLSDGESDDESNTEELDRDRAYLGGNTTDSHELSEAECDRDYHMRMRKGKPCAQFPFVKLRFGTVNDYGVCPDNE